MMKMKIIVYSQTGKMTRIHQNKKNVQKMNDIKIIQKLRLIYRPKLPYFIFLRKFPIFSYILSILISKYNGLYNGRRVTYYIG